jgi:MerC mercury resistance protein
MLQQHRQQQGTKNRFNSFFLCTFGCCPTPPNLLYCSAINSDASGSDSDSEASFEMINKDKFTSGLFPTKSKSSSLSLPSTTTTSWKERILQVSNYASALCVLDCTILPIVTVLLPLFGIAFASSHALHELGHRVALYFVLPVGFTATTTNYALNHRKKWITAIGWVGLAAIFLANAGCSFGHGWNGPIGRGLHHLSHAIHHGVAHRVANLTGCSLLIISNTLARRQGGCAMHGPNCDHKH